MENVFAFVVVLALLGLSLTAYFTVAQALFSTRIARTYAALSESPRRAALVGVVNLGFFVALGLVFASWADKSGMAVLALPTLAIAFGLTVALSGGLAALVRYIAERIMPELTGVRQTALGVLALGLACALPYAGWFVLTPYVCALALGADVLGLWRKEML